MPSIGSASPTIGWPASLALTATTRLIGSLYFDGELEVALVVRRDAEDGAGAIIHQHEVRDVDGQAPVAVERMDGLDPGAKTLLLGGLDLGRAGAALAAFGDELGGLRIACRERLGDRMGWRDGDEARAEDGVGARGEDFDLVDAVRRFGEAEAELAGRGSCRSSSPASA